MGVELSIPDFSITSISSLLPPWCPRPEARQPLSMDVDEDTVLSEPEDMPDTQTTVLTPGLLSAVSEAGCERFMQNCITIPGMLHTAHNILCDIRETLTHWQEFKVQLKLLESFLSVPERRSHYVHAILRDSPFAHQAAMFLHFSGSLYEARWEEVIHFLDAVLPLLPVLAATWNTSSFSYLAQKKDTETEAPDKC